MKFYRNAIILLIVIAVLVAGVILSGKLKKEEDPFGSRSETVRILDLRTDDMAEITVESSEGKYVFERQTRKETTTNSDGKEEVREVKFWALITPTDITADESQLNSIAINLSSLIAERVIEENATDFSKYGLDKPRTLSVKLTDGSTVAVELGNKTPTNGAYYIKKKGENTVYTLGTYTGDKLNFNRNSIKNKQLLTVNPEEVTGFKLDRRAETVFTAERANKDADWQLTTPIKASVNTSALGPMLDSVAEITAMNFIEENPSDLGQYGLAAPAYRLEIKQGEQITTLLLGNEKEKGLEVYAKFADKSEVFTIGLSNFTYLDKPLKEIVEVFAYITNIQDVNKIEILMDGRNDVLEIQYDTSEEHDNENDKFFLNGKPANVKNAKDKQLARNLFQSLIGVTLSEVEPDAVPAGNADITFTYHRKNEPTLVKVEFIPKNDYYYYVMRNGEYTGIVVEKSKFDKPADEQYSEVGGPRVALKILKDAMDQEAAAK